MSNRMVKINNHFKECECILLTEKIENNKTPLSFICFCGMTAEKNFDAFRRAPHCTECKLSDLIEINRKLELRNKKKPVLKIVTKI